MKIKFESVIKGARDAPFFLPSDDHKFKCYKHLIILTLLFEVKKVIFCYEI